MENLKGRHIYKRLFNIVLISLFLFSVVFAQKDKDKKNQLPETQTQSLEQKLDELSNDISKELTDGQKTTVAVAEFVDLNGKTSDFGKFLSEELVTRLFKTKKLKVVERQRLDKVIAEQKLSLTELIESSSAKRIGRILGVEAIVAGSISEIGSGFRVNARIINTESGELISASGITVPKDADVCSLIPCKSKSVLTSISGEKSDSQNKEIIKIPSKKEVSNLSQPVEKKQALIYKDFIFEFDTCTSSGGDSVTCWFSITNRGQERFLSIGMAGSYFLDDLKDKYTVSSIWIGNKTGSDALFGYSVSDDIPYQAPVKGILKFEGTKTQAKTIKLLRISCSMNNGNERFNIDFRDVPISITKRNY